LRIRGKKSALERKTHRRRRRNILCIGKASLKKGKLCTRGKICCMKVKLEWSKGKTFSRRKNPFAG
jgi:hypothetical protein